MPYFDIRYLYVIDNLESTMVLWQTKFTTARPLVSMPQLYCVAQERRDNPKYRCCGRYRQSERHCLFKYTLSGEGAFQDANGVHRVPEGYGFLCEIYDPATEYFYPEEGEKPWEFVFACFTGDTASAMTRELLRRHGPIFKLDPACQTVKRIMAMHGDENEVREISAGEGAALAFEILSSLETSKNPPGGPKDAGAELIRRAKRRIEESLPRGMPIGELAAILEVSREHLSRVFSRETGESPHEHMAKARMRHACRLLKESSLDVKEIGDQLGIEIPQHFTRLFKKTLKMTPTQFRLHGVVPEF